MFLNINVEQISNTSLALLNNENYDWNRVNDFSLLEYFDDNKKYINEEEYIVFTTKVRIEHFDNSYQEFLNKLEYYCNTVKLNKPIVILGERKLGHNEKTMAHTKNIFCIYDKLINLKNNNKVYDMTENILLYNTPMKDVFLRDINILKNAESIVCLGYGGNFCINISFGKNIKCLFTNISSKWKNNFKNHKNLNLYFDFNSFLEDIKKL
jgi:hypothetical protein